MKSCLFCHNSINEQDPKEKWFMAITKKGQKIIEFKCFHFECWKKFWNESVTLEIMQRKEK